MKNDHLLDHHTPTKHHTERVAASGDPDQISVRNPKSSGMIYSRIRDSRRIDTELVRYQRLVRRKPARHRVLRTGYLDRFAK